MLSRYSRTLRHSLHVEQLAADAQGPSQSGVSVTMIPHSQEMASHAHRMEDHPHGTEGICSGDIRGWRSVGHRMSRVSGAEGEGARRNKRGDLTACGPSIFRGRGALHWRMPATVAVNRGFDLLQGIPSRGALQVGSVRLGLQASATRLSAFGSVSGFRPRRRFGVSLGLLCLTLVAAGAAPSACPDPSRQSASPQPRRLPDPSG